MTCNVILPPKNEQELLARSYQLSGKSLGDLAQQFDFVVPENLKKSKGWVGQFLEKCLGASAESRPVPDFEHLGIELKTIPVNLEGKPIESTYVCSISLCALGKETWDTSLVKRKLSKVLWVPIEWDKGQSIASRIVGTPSLWSPSEEDERILRQDYQELTDMMVLGQIENITGKMGVYLQVRPKAANSHSLRKGINQEGRLTLTLPRGFYLRAIFTTKILQKSYTM